MLTIDWLLLQSMTCSLRCKRGGPASRSFGSIALEHQLRLVTRLAGLRGLPPTTMAEAADGRDDRRAQPRRPARRRVVGNSIGGNDRRAMGQEHPKVLRCCRTSCAIARSAIARWETSKKPGLNRRGQVVGRPRAIDRCVWILTGAIKSEHDWTSCPKPLTMRTAQRGRRHH
jgi:hypothetical protein